jgi:hypothetical protein
MELDKKLKIFNLSNDKRLLMDNQFKVDAL